MVVVQQVNIIKALWFSAPKAIGDIGVSGEGLLRNYILHYFTIHPDLYNISVIAEEDKLLDHVLDTLVAKQYAERIACIPHADPQAVEPVTRKEKWFNFECHLDHNDNWPHLSPTSKDPTL